MSKILRARGDHVVMSFEHASITVDTTAKLFKAARKMVIEKVDYYNLTGLAANGANFVAISVRKSATDMTVPRATSSVGLTADAFTDLAASATPANRVLAENDEMTLFVDCTGTVTLPAGRVIVQARYV